MKSRSEPLPTQGEAVENRRASESSTKLGRRFRKQELPSTLSQLPPDLIRHRVLDTAEAAAFCRFSVAHWRRLYRKGQAPSPVRLSARKSGWRVGDLIDWIETQRARGG